MKDRIFPGSGYRTQHCGNELGKNCRPRRAPTPMWNVRIKTRSARYSEARRTQENTEASCCLPARGEYWISYYKISSRRFRQEWQTYNHKPSRKSSGVCIQCRIGWARPQQTSVRTTVTQRPTPARRRYSCACRLISAPHRCPDRSTNPPVIPWIKQSTR